MSYDPYTQQRIPVVSGPAAPRFPPTAEIVGRKPLVSPLIVVLVVASVIGLVLGTAVAGDLAREPPGRRAATASAAPDLVTVPFSAVSDREWRLITAEPDAYAGAAIVVFGSVQEAGIAGGAVRVRAGATRREFRTDALLIGDELLLGNLAVNDRFTAKVIVTARTAPAAATGVAPAGTAPAAALRLEVRHIEIV